MTDSTGSRSYEHRLRGSQILQTIDTRGANLNGASQVPAKPFDRKDALRRLHAKINRRTSVSPARNVKTEDVVLKTVQKDTHYLVVQDSNGNILYYTPEGLDITILVRHIEQKVKRDFFSELQATIAVKDEEISHLQKNCESVLKTVFLLSQVAGASATLESADPATIRHLQQKIKHYEEENKILRDCLDRALASKDDEPDEHENTVHMLRDLRGGQKFGPRYSAASLPGKVKITEPTSWSPPNLSNGYGHPRLSSIATVGTATSAPFKTGHSFNDSDTTTVPNSPNNKFQSVVKERAYTLQPDVGITSLEDVMGSNMSDSGFQQQKPLQQGPISSLYNDDGPGIDIEVANEMMIVSNIENMPAPSVLETGIDITGLRGEVYDFSKPFIKKSRFAKFMNGDSAPQPSPVEAGFPIDVFDSRQNYEWNRMTQQAAARYDYKESGQRPSLPGIFSHGIKFQPSSHHASYYRTVRISNMPGNVTLYDVLLRVRGGIVYSAVLLDTMKLLGSMTALIQFGNAKSAEEYASYTHQNPIRFNERSRQIEALTTLVDTPTYPLRPSDYQSMFRDNMTRVLSIPHLPEHITIDKVRDDLARNNEHIDETYAGPLLHFELGMNRTLRLEFAGLQAARSAFTIITSHKHYNGLNIYYEPDPCDAAVQELALPTVLRDGLPPRMRHSMSAVDARMPPRYRKTDSQNSKDNNISTFDVDPQVNQMQRKASVVLNSKPIVIPSFSGANLKGKSWADDTDSDSESENVVATSLTSCDVASQDAGVEKQVESTNLDKFDRLHKNDTTIQYPSGLSESICAPTRSSAVDPELDTKQLSSFQDLNKCTNSRDLHLAPHVSLSTHISSCSGEISASSQVVSAEGPSIPDFEHDYDISDVSTLVNDQVSPFSLIATGRDEFGKAPVLPPGFESQILSRSLSLQRLPCPTVPPGLEDIIIKRTQSFDRVPIQQHHSNSPSTPTRATTRFTSSSEDTVLGAAANDHSDNTQHHKIAPDHSKFALQLGFDPAFDDPFVDAHKSSSSSPVFHKRGRRITPPHTKTEKLKSDLSNNNPDEIALISDDEGFGIAPPRNFEDYLSNGHYRLNSPPPCHSNAQLDNCAFTGSVRRRGVRGRALNLMGEDEWNEEIGAAPTKTFEVIKNGRKYRRYIGADGYERTKIVRLPTRLNTNVAKAPDSVIAVEPIKHDTDEPILPSVWRPNEVVQVPRLEYHILQNRLGLSFSVEKDESIGPVCLYDPRDNDRSADTPWIGDGKIYSQDVKLEDGRVFAVVVNGEGKLEHFVQCEYNWY